MMHIHIARTGLFKEGFPIDGLGGGTDAEFFDWFCANTGHSAQQLVFTFRDIWPYCRAIYVRKWDDPATSKSLQQHVFYLHLCQHPFLSNCLISALTGSPYLKRFGWVI